MHRPARLGSGYPLAFARCRRNPTVKAAGQLEGHQRSTLLGLVKEPSQIARGLVRQNTGPYFDPGLTQYGKPLASDTRITVFDRTDHARYTCVDQSFRTGRRLAVMSTGFKRDIGRSTTRQISGLRQRFCLGMRTPSGLCPTTTDNTPVTHNDTSHSRIGPAIALSAPPQRQGERHKPFIQLDYSSFCWVGGLSSWTKSSKSSAAWKFLYTLANRT